MVLVSGVFSMLCGSLVCDLKLCRLKFLCRCSRLSMYLNGRCLVVIILLLLNEVGVLVLFR